MLSLTKTSWLLTGALCAPLLLAAPASAQGRDPAAAQALFDQAKELIRQKRFAEACPKLQESNRLDPGIGTQFNLADCYEQSGRIASAWAAFLEVVSQARASGESDREKAAQKRADKLEPRLPKLLVIVPDGSQVSGLEVRRNGVSVGAPQWGTPMPVDPGEIELTASAPGKLTAKQGLRLEEGRTVTYNVPELAADRSAVVAAPGPAPAAPAEEAEPKQSDSKDAEPAAKGGSNAPWIITLAAAGVVGLGVGTTFAVLAKNEYNDSLANCPNDPNHCNSAGVEQRNSAITKGNVATVAFIAGGAALAGAGVVWLLSGSSSEHGAAPSKSHVAVYPVVGPQLAAAGMHGSF